ncbi:(E,E)-geranyllinalool synthase [Lycium ferocissimum]|uniref:(E,E)-geranyllinalool synthase n=1 Tax=Lycium ferocissimum TaxID=112874 RepID=UPI002814F166|nr:(E,E)-geranyllinalool synthase [Lycium ferocissimum]
MDSSSLSSIESLVNEIKKELLISNQDFNNTFVTQTSAYDTAWLAMIPYNNQEANGPMFESCLNWILNNQNEQGFWGEPNGENLPTIYALPTTLACMIALKKWNVGESHVRKGLKFIHANTDALLKENSQRFPLWFTIVFPSMLQLAKAQGLDTILVNGSNGLLSDVFMKKKAILESEKLNGLRAGQDQPILTYLESLSHSDNCIVNEEIEVLKHLCEEDGSLFQSPSAIAQAFMATGSTKCLEYLMSIVQKCPNGVPSRFPVDEELEMLCMVDNIQRMGVALHFEKEIQQILDQVYKNYQTNLQTNEYVSPETSDLPERLFKDSLAFRLLRLQGYKINQGSFCWFLNQPHTRAYMEKNQEQFAYVMYNVYRATDLMFNGESEMEEARSFSRNFLVNNDNLSVPPALQKLIEHELNVPWFARLEHLDHRLWIELNQSLRHTIGKSPYYWLSYLQNDKLMQLAVQNYEYRQSIYRKELEDLKSWSKEKGLVGIGFGREKTTYSYFASAASSSSFLPYESFLRLVVAKCSIVITVADDFYDEEASLSELQILTEAIQRWDAKTLDGPSKIIFEALDDLVCDVAKMYHLQHKIDITPQLQHMWKETFHSWMMESMWSRTSNLPSMDEYLKVGMISIGAHILVLHAASLACPTVPSEKLGPINGHYENITKLLMATTRFLNDIQSYQKEREVGKMNYTLLHLNENPEGHIEDSIDFIKKILGDKKKEFLENVLMDRSNDMPRTMKLLHLSCLNVFHMFFNSCNLFDTQTAILEDIMKAIYIPLQQEQQTPMPPPSKPLPPMLPPQEKKIEIAKFNACLNGKNFKQQVGNIGIGISFVGRQAPKNYNSFGWFTKGFASQKLRSCFL